MKLLLGNGDIDPNLTDNNGQTPLSFATMKERDDVVRLLSDFRTPNCKSSENRDPIPTYVASGAASDQVTHPPTAMEHIASHTTNHYLKRKRAGEKSRLRKRRKEQAFQWVVGSLG